MTGGPLPGAMVNFFVLVLVVAGAVSAREASAAWRPNAEDLDGLNISKHLRTLSQDAQGLIQGGNLAPRGRFPYMVLLINQNENPVCGGVLIHASWVLTAAHCLVSDDLDGPVPLGLNPRVKVGPLLISDQEGPGVTVTLGDATPHPQWDGNLVNGFDIALIKLREPVADIPPLALAQVGSEFIPGLRMRAMGWGQQGDGLGASERLKWTTLVFRSNELCNREDVWKGGILPNMLCAGGDLEGDTSLCQGDSGGPLILPHTPEGIDSPVGDPTLDVLVGLVSFGDDPACVEELSALKKPIIFTRVSVFRKWIDGVISGKSEPGTGDVTSLIDPSSTGVPQTPDPKLGQVVAEPPPTSNPPKITCGSRRECNEVNEDLLVSAEDGYLRGVRDALDQGADLDVMDEEGGTPLIRASENGHLEVVITLVEAGASLDIQDDEGSTALIWVAYNGDFDIVEYLVDQGASLDIQDDEGSTALIWAAFHGFPDIVEFLVEEGAEQDIEDEVGTAFEATCQGEDFGPCTSRDLRRIRRALG